MTKLLTPVFFLLTLFSSAQDAHFLAFQNNLIYLNPSFAGSAGVARNQLTYRNQGGGSNPVYVTYANTFDFYVAALKAGFAVSAIVDDQQMGTLKTSGVALTYAQHINLSESSKIIPSFQIGYGIKSLDHTSLHYGDVIDARLGSRWENISVIPQQNQNFYDFNAGLLYMYNNFTAGISAFHLNKPDVGLSGSLPFPVRTCLNLSLKSFYDNSLASLMTGFCNFQDELYHAQVNYNVLYRKVSLGAGYANQKSRNLYNDASASHFIANTVLLSAGLNYERFKIGYSYELPVGDNLNRTAVAHELSIQVLFKKGSHCPTSL
jgi:type IX secretion system PorP/SprF family membrane protein